MTTRAGAGGDLRDRLRDHVRAQLPSSMVPSIIIEIDELPTTPSGKVDVRALPEPPEPGAGADRPELGLDGPVEQAIAEIFATVLGGAVPDAERDFFRLGGTSVGAVRALMLIRERLSAPLTVVDFYQGATVRQLARAVAAGEGSEPPGSDR